MSNTRRLSPSHPADRAGHAAPGTSFIELDTLRVACSPMDDGHRTPHAVGRTTCQDGTRRASSWARRPSNIERHSEQGARRMSHVAQGIPCQERRATGSGGALQPLTKCGGVGSHEEESDLKAAYLY